MFSTDVTENDDGTYKVVGGNLNDRDKNIYVVGTDGKRTGETIGESLTMESFYYSETNEWKGTIDPTDGSGLKFINNDIIGNKNLGIISYMWNGVGGGDYDFKRLGPNRGKDEQNNSDYFYRGMPFGHKNDGEKVYASARDIGNYAAGYIAGREGLSWGESRMGFDALQSIQERGFSSESSSTQLSQKAGWNKGIGYFNSFIKRYKK